MSKHNCYGDEMPPIIQKVNPHRVTKDELVAVINIAIRLKKCEN